MLIPNVYRGHKGDQLILPVYRNGTLMLEQEIEGATDLEFHFKNLNGPEAFTITSGVWVGPKATVVYSTIEGDGVFEAVGTWEYQARGKTAAGEPFRSQPRYQKVEPVVP